MEFGPIFSALRHHKTGTILVALQIAVSLAIIVNAMFIINARIEKMNRPTGMDTANVVFISLRGVGDDYDAAANIRRDLDHLRNLPDVAEASLISQIPLSGSGSSTSIRVVPDLNVTPVMTATWAVDNKGIATLGVNLIRGRDFYPEEVQVVGADQESPDSPAVIIITQALADKLYPEQDALGKSVYWDDMSTSRIIGIIGQMQGAWSNWEGLERNLLLPRINEYKSANYMVKAKPGRRDALLANIETEVSGINKHRVIRSVRSFEDIVTRTYELDRTMALILGSVIALLIGLTALVIVGLASYFVSERTRQIGTRRALGATRFDILRYFLLENWIITTIGAVGGCLITTGIGYLLETSFNLPRLDWRYLAVGVLTLWVISQFAAFWPARKASAISPAIATRSV